MNTESSALYKIEEADSGYGRSGLFRLVRRYCHYSTSHELSDQQMLNQSAILDAASRDTELAYWIDRVEYYVAYEISGEREPSFDAVFSHLLSDRLICAVQGSSPDPFTKDDFVDLVRAFRFEPGFIDREIQFKDGKKPYKKILIYQPPLVVYATFWSPGQVSDWHHHGEAFDVIKSYRGTLHHEFLQGKSSHIDYRPLKPTDENTFSEDEYIVIGDSVIHRLGNLSCKELITLTFRLNLDPRLINAQSLPIVSHPVIKSSDEIDSLKESLSHCKLNTDFRPTRLP